MTEIELQRRVCEELGLRVGREVAAYLTKRLDEQPNGVEPRIPVMAGDARTGVPLYADLEPGALRLLLNPEN